MKDFLCFFYKTAWFNILLLAMTFLSEGCSDRQSNKSISPINTSSAVSSDELTALPVVPIKESPEKVNGKTSGLVPDPIIQNSRCQECHREQYDLWTGSFHRHAMASASSQNILADCAECNFTDFTFDELFNFSEETIRTILDQWLHVQISSELDPFTGMSKPSPIIRLVCALADCSEKHKKKLLDALSEENKERWSDELKFLTKCGPIRPDAIAESQTEITGFVKTLVKEGKIKSSLGSSIGLKKKGDLFSMMLPDRNGNEKEVAIKYVLGIFPLQQYLTEMEDGRVQALPYAWNVAEKKWFSLYPGEKILPGDPLHWAGALQNWNHMCADCHTTGYEKKFNSEKNEFASRWKEMGVGCSSCHSDCYDHEHKALLLWDRIKLKENVSSEAIRKKMIRAGFSSKTTRLTDNANNVELVESCAPCHSRRHNLDEKLRPTGEKYSNFHVPERVGSQVYYADGQFKEECFEYGSFTQSRMYAMGVRCTDCHDAHSLRLKKPGNELCAQCHRSDFYDSPNHHHHKTKVIAVESPLYSLPVKTPVQQTRTKGPGMNCVDCHLPSMNFMMIDKRYDHNIHIPRPQLTLDLGTPNACNRCHYRRDKKEDATWAQSWINRWYKPENSIRRGQLSQGEHYAYALSEGMRGSANGLHLLEKVIREKETAKVRDIVRAGACDLLLRYQTINEKENTEKIVELLKSCLTDSNEWVRRAAVTGLESSSEQTRIQYLFPLLNDNSRSVRSEAIRILSSIDCDKLSETERKRFDEVVAEYRRELAVNEDQGASWLNLGVLEQNLRQAKLTGAMETLKRISQTPNVPTALLESVQSDVTRKEYESAQKSIGAYRKGNEIAPDFLPLRVNLAMLYYQQGDFIAAEREFREAVRIDPSQGETHYSLALLLAESNRLPEAKDEFVKAAELLPKRYRVLYNCALALDRIGETERAVKTLEKALKLEPNSKECQSALDLFRQKLRNK